jgi:molybdopterin-containing oxidoreductase family membrane subunit
LALGAVGLVWRFVGGHAAANYGSYVPWGLWIAAYVAFVGASAGAFALSALILTTRQTTHYRLAILAMLVAFGTFAAGMTNVWLDLGHPFRAYKLLFDTEFGSIMGVMAWLYTIYALVLLVGLFATRHGHIPEFLKRFSWLAFLFAIVFAGAEGALFGVVGARPLWESGLTPVLFLVEAALFGIALVAVAAAVFGVLTPDSARHMGVGMLVLLAILVVLEFSEYSTGLIAAVPAKEEALRTIIAGDFWWVFWFLHLGVGVVVPAVLLLRGRSKVMVVGIAGALIGSMAIASKLNLVLPALAQEEIKGLTEAFHGPGLATEYFPSVMEWMVWVGTLGLAGLIVLLGHRFMRGAFGTTRADDTDPSLTTDDLDTTDSTTLQEAIS